LTVQLQALKKRGTKADPLMDFLSKGKLNVNIWTLVERSEGEVDAQACAFIFSFSALLSICFWLG
jgi:hypothetical protein